MSDYPKTLSKEGQPTDASTISKIKELVEHLRGPK